MSGGSIWEQFTHDPRHADNARLRAADKDRDVVNEALGTAYAEGRLTPEEFDERSDQVAAAKTLAELPPLLADLIAPTTGLAPRPLVGGSHRLEAERRYRMQRQQALFAFLTPTLICWVVWTATMFGGFPWPLIVTIATSLRWVQLTLSKEDTIVSIEHSLQRKERRRLEAREKRAARHLPPPPDPPQLPGTTPPHLPGHRPPHSPPDE